MYGARIISTGKYVPDNILSNDDLSNFLDTNDQWISSRTGIEKRRITKGENTSDIASKAAIDALNKSNLAIEDIGLIIVATSTPDCYTPSTACIVQNKIKAVNAVCFDISAACSGFIYGVTIAKQFIKNGLVKNALVIGAETLSKILDWNDRSTCVLFGDGAGAVILSQSPKEYIQNTYIGSDGTGNDFLKCNAAKLTLNNDKLREKISGNEEEDINKYLTMQGKEVFRFAVKVMESSIEKLLEESKLNIEDIKYIVPHQANLRIIEHIIKKLKVPREKIYTNLQKYGNTSAASIPIALAEMDEQNMLNAKDKIIIVGFGAGLTWGSILIEWI